MFDEEFLILCITLAVLQQFNHILMNVKVLWILWNCYTIRSTYIKKKEAGEPIMSFSEVAFICEYAHITIFHHKAINHKLEDK